MSHVSKGCCSSIPSMIRQAFNAVTNIFGPSSTRVHQSGVHGEPDPSTNGTVILDKQNTKNEVRVEDKLNVIAAQSTTTTNNIAEKENNKIINTTISMENEEQIKRDKHSLDSNEISDWEPSDYEKDLVKITWSDDFDFLYELGSAIYGFIFAHNPSTKTLFPGIHRHGDNWKDSKEFRSQALKFVQTISHSVKNLYHMERLATFLYKIGERHVKFAARGFKPEMWDDFLDAMEAAITNHIRDLNGITDQQRIDALIVWRRLSFYLITHMKHGYFDQLAKDNENGSIKSNTERQSITMSLG